MKRKVKIIGGIVLGVLVVIYAVVSALMPMAVETKTITYGESEISFVESGVVVNIGEKMIFPMAAGEVDEIYVKEGDLVKAGDVLASLNKNGVNMEVLGLEKTVEGLEAQLASAEINHQNQVDTLEAQISGLRGQLSTLDAQSGSTTSRELEQLLLAQSKETYERGLEDLEKYQQLFDLGYISESEFEDFQSLVDTYAANYNTNVIAASAGDVSYDGTKASLVAQINSLEATLERDTLSVTMAYNQAMLDGAKASLEAAKVQAGYFDITSTVDGVVNEIMIENVNMVTGLEPAFIVQGDGENKVEVKVNTRDIEVLNEGDEVVLILDRRTGDIEITGTITHISTSASVEISALGVEERKVQVIIDPSSDDVLGAGYDVDVKFIVFSAQDKLVVPNSAIYQKDEKDMVMVIKNGVATEVEVVLGYELTGETIVDSGLEDGDQIVIDLDAKDLSPGKRINSSNE